MPFDLEVLDDRTPLTITWKGETIHVVYRPSAFTDRLVKDETTSGVDTVNRELLATVVDWDITAGGLKVPLDEAGIARVPFPLKTFINAEVVKDALNPTTTARSPGAPGRTGISSSGGPPAATSAPTNGLSASPLGSGSAT